MPAAEVGVAQAVGACGGEGQRVVHPGRTAHVDGEDAGADPVVEGQDVGVGTARAVVGGTPGGDAVRPGLFGRQQADRPVRCGHVLFGDRAVVAVAHRGEQARRCDLVEGADLGDRTRGERVTGRVRHGDGQGVAGDDLRVRLRGGDVRHRGGAHGLGPGAPPLLGRRSLERGVGDEHPVVRRALTGGQREVGATVLVGVVRVVTGDVAVVLQLEPRTQPLHRRGDRCQFEPDLTGASPDRQQVRAGPGAVADRQSHPFGGQLVQVGAQEVR